MLHTLFTMQKWDARIHKQKKSGDPPTLQSERSPPAGPVLHQAQSLDAEGKKAMERTNPKTKVAKRSRWKAKRWIFFVTLVIAFMIVPDIIHHDFVQAAWDVIANWIGNLLADLTKWFLKPLLKALLRRFFIP